MKNKMIINEYVIVIYFFVIVIYCDLNFEFQKLNIIFSKKKVLKEIFLNIYILKNKKFYNN